MRKPIVGKFESKLFPGVVAVQRRFTHSDLTRFRKMIRHSPHGPNQKARAWTLFGLQGLILPPEVEGVPEDIKPAELLMDYCPSELANEITAKIQSYADGLGVVPA